MDRPLDSACMFHKHLRVGMSRIEFFPTSVNDDGLDLDTQVQRSFSILPSPLSPVLQPVGHKLEWHLVCVPTEPDSMSVPGSRPSLLPAWSPSWHSYWLLILYSCPTLNPLGHSKWPHSTRVIFVKCLIKIS